MNGKLATPPVTVNGEPSTGMRAPEVGSMPYAATWPALALCTSKTSFEGGAAIACGPGPVANGDPGTGLNAPVSPSTSSAVIVLDVKSGTYANRAMPPSQTTVIWVMSPPVTVPAPLASVQARPACVSIVT